MKPLAIDLYCGLGGWTSGLLDAGWDCIGFDIERHVYGAHRYPAQLVLQDARTLHGAQFKDAALIVASSPCQEYSFMAMPFGRGKQIARALRGQDEFPEGYTGSRTLAELNALFDVPKRIQREAIAAAGHHIPMVQENVRGAIPWVGRSAWNFGSYHLWGDVPALMPIPHKAVKLGGGASWYPPSDPRHQPGLDFTRLAGIAHAEGEKANPDGTAHGSGSWFKIADSKNRGSKNTGGSWFNIAHNATSGTGQNPVTGPHPNAPEYGVQVADELAGTKGYAARLGESPSARHGSKSSARKMASAQIAKIPYPLASFIARTYYPHPCGRSEQEGT